MGSELEISKVFTQFISSVLEMMVGWNAQHRKLQEILLPTILKCEGALTKLGVCKKN